MNIQVRPAQEGVGYNSFNVNMPRESTLADLKKIVKKRWDLHPKQQLVSYNFEELEDDSRTLASFQITSNATVYVGFVAAMIRVFIRPIDTRGQRKRLNVNLNWTVNELKQQAAAAMSIRELGHGQVKLCLGETELEGSTKLKNVEGLEDECNLYFKVREVGGKLAFSF